MATPSSFDRPRSVLWLSTLGLTAVIALCALAARAYVTASQSVDHTLEVLAVADEWLVTLYDAHTGGRGFAFSGDRRSAEPYERALGEERAIARRLKVLVADNPGQRRNVEQADRRARAVMQGSRSLVGMVESGRGDDARAWVASGESMRLLEAFRRSWLDVRSEEERYLLERREDARSRAVVAVGCAAVLALLSLGLLWSSWGLQRTATQKLDRVARDARARLQTLSDLAAALSDVRTPAQVAAVVVEQGMQAVGADTCTLYLLDEAGTALELIGDRGVAPGVLERIRRFTDAEDNGAFRTLRSGKGLWVESEKDYRAQFPEVATLKAEGPRAHAFWSVPLVVEGKPVGLLAMGFYEARQFSPDNRVLVETLARQCAQALLRASHLEREDRTRQWFTTTLRSIGDAVIATDAEGLIAFVNPVAATLTGWSESEARGRPLDEVFVILSEQTGEKVLRSKDGREIPIDDSGAPIRNEAGQLFGVVLVFRDVTREKKERARRDFLSKASDALVASLDYQVTLSTIARLAVPIIADWCSVHILEPGAAAPHQAVVAHVDPTKVRFARELGERYPADPHATRGAPEVIRSGKPELYPVIPSALLESAAQNQEHLRLMQELRLHSAMVVPLRSGGRMHGAMTFVYAESRRVYGEDDLAFAMDFARRAAMAIENSLALQQVEMAREQEHRLRAEAEIANRAKDEFLAVVSHELRTPLTAILGWTTTLRRRAPTPEADRALTIIERNARAQAKLIEDVLDVSRIIGGKLALSLGPTILGEAVTASLDTVSPAAEAKDIRIVVEVEANLPVILADADRIQQIVWNLLSNAVKFTPKGGQVALRAFCTGSDIHIVVSDSGEGIPPSALPLIFEPFQQADASTTRRHGGLGLGLAIVKQLVQAHGGTVRAESEGPALGSTFRVVLPARAAFPAMAKGARAAAGVDAIARVRLNGLRVLVVDDEADALEVVCEALRDGGAEVHSADSVRAALDRFTSVRPDVVVSDIGIPGEDGYSLVKKIRALSAEQGGRTPAVALTAYARAEDAQRAFAAGYQIHVAKPVSPDQLLTAVANLGGLSLEPA